MTLPPATVGLWRCDVPGLIARSSHCKNMGTTSPQNMHWRMVAEKLSCRLRFCELQAGFLAYSMGMAAAEIQGSVYLHRHGHKTLARIVDSVSVATGVATDIRNATIR